MSSTADAVAAIRAGEPVVLPFDTVYGLAADARSEAATRRLYALKGRAETQPSALVARDVPYLLDCLPELRERGETVVRALLPGPFTLIFPNPAHRFRWLTGSNPSALGVRVPALGDATRTVVEQVGIVVATSANRPGERDPATLAEIPEEIRTSVVAVDGGVLPGTPSTVIDFTGHEPRVLREGAVSGAEALHRLQAPVRSG